jgi:hypothetical protein
MKIKTKFAIVILQWDSIYFYTSRRKFEEDKKFYFEGSGLKYIYTFEGSIYKHLVRLPKEKDWEEKSSNF